MGMLLDDTSQPNLPAVAEETLRQLSGPQIVAERVLSESELPSRDFEIQDEQGRTFKLQLNDDGDIELQASEVEVLKNLFKQEVSDSDLGLTAEYMSWARGEALRMVVESGQDLGRDQFFVFADRSPEGQVAMVAYFDSSQKKVIDIGWTPVSTGDASRFGHFETPVGVFKNIFNVGFRAEGTPNSKGFRGYGEKGKRVWDFGWQWTEDRNPEREIRLLMHATDPELGEPLLGQQASKGCVRIPAALNEFIDKYGLMDHHEELKNTWLLRGDRVPTQHPGSLLVVADSSKVRDLEPQSTEEIVSTD